MLAVRKTITVRQAVLNLQTAHGTSDVFNLFLREYGTFELQPAAAEFRQLPRTNSEQNVPPFVNQDTARIVELERRLQQQDDEKYLLQQKVHKSRLQVRRLTEDLIENDTLLGSLSTSKSFSKGKMFETDFISFASNYILKFPGLDQVTCENAAGSRNAGDAHFIYKNQVLHVTDVKHYVQNVPCQEYTKLQHDLMRVGAHSGSLISKRSAVSVGVGKLVTEPQINATVSIFPNFVDNIDTSVQSMRVLLMMSKIKHDNTIPEDRAQEIACNLDRLVQRYTRTVKNNRTILVAAAENEKIFVRDLNEFTAKLRDDFGIVCKKIPNCKRYSAAISLSSSADAKKHRSAER